VVREKTLIKLTATIIAICIMAPLVAEQSNATFTPRFSNIRVGLFTGENALPSANLRNADGLGSGFEFGYFDTDRNFIPIGAWTDETSITMMMDRNMVWQAGTFGEYREGTSGNVVVGCFHVRLNMGFNTFEEAKAEASMHQGAFVRFQADQQYPFLVLIGQHTTRAAAEAALSALGLGSVATVCAGTQNTIKVVITGTNTIIFEYDRGTTPLGVMPRPIWDENPETWFRGFRYNGAFQYSRRDGALLTVLQIVDIEDYVKGILPYEMSNTWPMEALKAQAVVARTFAMRSLLRHGTQGFDLCVTEHCQVYRGRGLANERTDQAVEETRGIYVTYDGQPAETVYASSNGGASENVENVWLEERPYLRGVIDPFEADVIPRIQNYHWTISYTQAQMTERIRSRFPGLNLGTITAVRVSRYSPTGNALAVTVTGSGGRTHTFSGRYAMINAFGVHTLRFDIGNTTWQPGSIFVNHPAQPMPPGSQVFAVDSGGFAVAVPDNNTFAMAGDGNVSAVSGEPTGGGSTTGLINGQFTFRGSGNGHQVGMSQWGAFSMAHYHNKTFEDIIHFYFTGVEITRTAGIGHHF